MPPMLNKNFLVGCTKRVECLWNDVFAIRTCFPKNDLKITRKYNSLEESFRLNFFADFFLEASLGLEEFASDLGFEVPPLNLKMK